jgi:hypothetical protein
MKADFTYNSAGQENNYLVQAPAIMGLQPPNQGSIEKSTKCKRSHCSQCCVIDTGNGSKSCLQKHRHRRVLFYGIHQKARYSWVGFGRGNDFLM